MKPDGNINTMTEKRTVQTEKIPIDGYHDVADARLHYLDWGGCGIPAHLLHANGFCAGTYGPFVRHLTEHYRMIASDVRGHGDSTRFETQRIRHRKVFAADLASVVREALPIPVLGIGHSLGAVATLIAAVRYPSLFAGIVLIEPPILPPLILWIISLMKLCGLRSRIPLARGARRRVQTFQNKRAAFDRFASGRGIFKQWSPEFIDAYLQCGLLEQDDRTSILKCDPELEAQIFESIPTDIWRYARKVSCPVLLIRGAASDTLLPGAAQRLSRKIPNCRLEVIESTGHFPPMEKPSLCANIIVNFSKTSIPPLEVCRSPSA